MHAHIWHVHINANTTKTLFHIINYIKMYNDKKETAMWNYTDGIRIENTFSILALGDNIQTSFKEIIY